MSGLVKGLLWVLLAVGLAVTLVVGYAIFQLSQMYPNEQEGVALAERIESQVSTEHPAFTVTARADRPFGEVTAKITPVNGELTDGVAGVLETLQAITVETEDSRWSVKSTVEGRWGTSELQIMGSDASRWPELSSVLVAATSSRVRVSLYLDHDRVVVQHRRDAEEVCGPGADVAEYFSGEVARVGDLTEELGWTTGDQPVLLYVGRACEEEPLSLYLDVSGDARPARITDLQEVIAALPADQPPTSIMVEVEGRLQLSLIHI